MRYEFILICLIPWVGRASKNKDAWHLSLGRQEGSILYRLTLGHAVSVTFRSQGWMKRPEESDFSLSFQSWLREKSIVSRGRKQGDPSCVEAGKDPTMKVADPAGCLWVCLNPLWRGHKLSLTIVKDGWYSHLFSHCQFRKNAFMKLLSIDCTY